MGVASSGRAQGWRRILLGLLGALSATPLMAHPVQGHLTVGPMCGGPQLVGQSCDVDYADIEVSLVDGSGRAVARTRSNAQGRFTLDGPTGSLRLKVMSPKVVRCPEPVLELPLIAASVIVVPCDSGRR